MAKERYWIVLNSTEIRLLINSLVRMKNKLIRQGRYTDCVDELIGKLCG